jgi:ApaG protein
MTMPIPSRAPPRSVYEARTRDVLVRVTPTYVPEQSDPDRSRFTWAYTVEIENHGEETLQLVSRHWIITDGLNRTEEVKAAGVVGEQPTLKPREAFRYTSGCPLPTPSGAMRGAYQMMTEAGETFDAEIPEFSLHMPDATRRMN